jgi:hypothetical protein
MAGRNYRVFPAFDATGVVAGRESNVERGAAQQANPPAPTHTVSGPLTLYAALSPRYGG